MAGLFTLIHIASLSASSQGRQYVLHWS